MTPLQTGRTPRRTPLRARPSPSPFQARHASAAPPAKTPGRAPAVSTQHAAPITPARPKTAAAAAPALVDTSNDTVKVVVRVRPLNSREIDGGETSVKDERFLYLALLLPLPLDLPFPVHLLPSGGNICASVSGENKVVLQAHPEPQVFTFDNVSHESSSQEDIFQGKRPPLPGALLSSSLPFSPTAPLPVCLTRALR